MSYMKRKYAFVAVNLIFIAAIVSCARGSREYTKCEEGCHYRHMSCLDGCPRDSVNFSFDFSTGFYSCHERCETIYKSCLKGCAVLDK